MRTGKEAAASWKCGWGLEKETRGSGKAQREPGKWNLKERKDRRKEVKSLEAKLLSQKLKGRMKDTGKKEVGRETNN